MTKPQDMWNAYQHFLIAKDVKAVRGLWFVLATTPRAVLAELARYARAIPCPLRCDAHYRTGVAVDWKCCIIVHLKKMVQRIQGQTALDQATTTTQHAHNQRTNTLRKEKYSSQLPRAKQQRLHQVP